MTDKPHANRLHAMMSGSDRSIAGRGYRLTASLITPIYRAVVRRRNRRFDQCIDVHHAHVPVISIGNLTTGGTGKTPMTIFVCQRLRELGHRPAVLTRGYMADEKGRSDEAALMTRRLAESPGVPGVPIIVNADRVAGAMQAMVEHESVDVLVMDDGFQHRRLARQVDLVLIDATCPFGFDHQLPRGMLREPVESLRRATATVITHAERVTPAHQKQIDEQIARHHGKPVVAHFEHRWSGMVDAAGAQVGLTSRRFVAACGIGNPQAFFDEATQHANVVATHAFGDHHRYTPADVKRMKELIKQHEADAVLTTEKDWVKLQPLVADQPDAPFWHSILDLQPRQGDDVLDATLQLAFDATI